ncbi:MAG: DeoR family transcriptional regulator [Bacteroidaceae bacterium]|nr:DeoR family transcriptional regulator [Bacteroidaceae bacterium]
MIMNTSSDTKDCIKSVKSVCRYHFFRTMSSQTPLFPWKYKKMITKQLDNMEKRGSGLTRFCNTKALEGYKDELKSKSKFKSTPSKFRTIIFASSDTSNGGDMSETKLTERQQKILNLIKESPTITSRQMSETLSVSQRTIKRDLSAMQKIGVLKREGKDNDGGIISE